MASFIRTEHVTLMDGEVCFGIYYSAVCWAVATAPIRRIEWRDVYQDKPWQPAMYNDDVIKGKLFRVTALCAGNSLVTGEIRLHRPLTRKFDVFFDMRPNKRFINNRGLVIWDVLIMTSLQCDWSVSILPRKRRNTLRCIQRQWTVIAKRPNWQCHYDDVCVYTWWRHQMETPVTSEFPAQRLATRSCEMPPR